MLFNPRSHESASNRDPTQMSSLTWFDQDIRCEVSAPATTTTDTGPFPFLPMRASETSGRTLLGKSCALTPPPPVPRVLIARKVAKHLSIRKRPRRRIFGTAYVWPIRGLERSHPQVRASCVGWIRSSMQSPSAV
jgi:hypothetical protein